MGGCRGGAKNCHGDGPFPPPVSEAAALHTLRPRRGGEADAAAGRRGKAEPRTDGSIADDDAVADDGGRGDPIP